VLKSLLHKNYLIFGGSIIATRALEYAVLFFAAHYLSKDNYGELEYYKKLIEVGSSVFAFGFPALIISYTKSKESKQYFFLLSVLFVVLLAIVSIPILGFIGSFFLLFPFIFYALFFNGGITPAYLLVKNGSNYASLYKIIISILFYSVIFISIYFFDVTGMAYVYGTYFLFPIAVVYIIYKLLQQNLVRTKLKKYWELFKKLLLSSLTLVISNFANLMFLYTDIFIIKIMSENANSEIADFSFALNISNMLLLIPLTLVQVDIEKLKQSGNYFNILNKKIMFLLAIATVALIVFYKIFIETIFYDFNETMTLFLIILIAKLFHSLSSIYGTNLLIFKKYKDNLIVNITMLLLNVVLCYFLYNKIGLNGVAIASAISLFIRYIILIKLNNTLVFKTTKK
jgi:O-antigen/teichoic acid export membrane protein